MRSIKRWTGFAMAIGISMPGPFATAGERAEDLAAPVRLEADGEPIDHGAVWGHAGPCVHDVDGDGKRDLVVGDFSGTFTFYRNVGTNDKPRYESAGKLMAGEEPAKVWIYCCIGSSPQFADINGDGHDDLITGSYDPGACYWFPGNGDGTFQGCDGEIAKQLAKTQPPATDDGEEKEDEREPHANANGLPLKDRKGRDILRKPDQVDSYESFGSWPDPVDWDADGDWDLVIGGFDGSVWLRENLGTKTEFAFSETPVAIEAEGKPIIVKASVGTPVGHAAVVVADWDEDGLFDLVSGCKDGSCCWFKNTGKKGNPRFAAAEMLVGPREDDGFDQFIEPSEIPPPGIRIQVTVADMNGDRKPDLLVGDFSSTRIPREDLTDKQRAAYKKARDAHETAAEKYTTANWDMQEQAMDVFEGVPEDEKHLDVHWVKWRKRMEELRSEPEYVALKKEYESTKEKVEQYLQKASKEKAVLDNFATPHGFVWLYVRK